MSRNPNNRDIDRQPKPEQDMPPAGPHGKPEQTDRDKTPGSGVLPDPDAPDVEGPTG
jgi:hypothetical protein